MGLAMRSDSGMRYSYRLEKSRLERLLQAGASLGGWGLALWVMTLALLQEIFVPAWSPPRRANLAALLGVPIGLAIGGRRVLGRYYAIETNGSVVRLRRFGASVALDPSTVQGLVGLAGFSFDGGEMIVWRRLAVIAESGRYFLDFDPEQNAECYQALREFCPRAWGLPFRGSLDPPSGDGNRDRDWLEATLRFGREKILASFLLGGALTFGTGVALWMALRTRIDGDEGKGVLALLILFVCGMLLIGDAFRRRRQLARAIRGSLMPGEDHES